MAQAAVNPEPHYIRIRVILSNGDRASQIERVSSHRLPDISGVPLAGLRRPNLHLRDGCVEVRDAFLHVRKHQVWKGPKSKASRRTIFLSDSLVAALREVLAEQDRAKKILGRDYYGHGLVFCQTGMCWMLQ